MAFITPIEKMKWAVNAFIIRNTPNGILKRFREGRYLTYTDACNGTEHKRGYLSWPHTNRLIDRCTHCGFYLKSHQDLNTEPLALSFLEAYYHTRRRPEGRGFHYRITDMAAREQLNEENTEKLASLLGEDKYHILNRPMKAFLFYYMTAPTADELKDGVEGVEYISEMTVFALSREYDAIILHTTDGNTYPSRRYDLSITETAS